MASTTFGVLVGSILVGAALISAAMIVRPQSPATPPPAPSVAPPDPVDVEAFALARAIRTYYPNARAADDAAEDERNCFKRPGADRTVCATTYFNRLAEVNSAAAAAVPGAPPGCPSQLARAVVEVISDAIKHDAVRPKEEPLGVTFTKVHASYRECSDRLFRYKIGRTLQGPPTAPGVATYLGVREDVGLLGPIRPGLFTATGTVVDEAAIYGR